MTQSIDTMSVMGAIGACCPARSCSPERTNQTRVRALQVAAAVNVPDAKHQLGVTPESTVLAPAIVGTARGNALTSARNELQPKPWRQMAPFAKP